MFKSIRYYFRYCNLNFQIWGEEQQPLCLSDLEIIPQNHNDRQKLSNFPNTTCTVQVITLNCGLPSQSFHHKLQSENKMSDFSKLLGKLQDTANTAKKAAALTHTHTHSSSSSASSKKRKLQEHSETQQAPRRRQLDVHVQPRLRRPHDIHDLKVKVSFLCIGAQKAGTTWLHEMLRRHQDLSLPDQKEVHFFDWHRNKGLKWYSNQWPRSISSLKGEITPCYAVLGSEKVSPV